MANRVEQLERRIAEMERLLQKVPQLERDFRDVQEAAYQAREIASSHGRRHFDENLDPARPHLAHRLNSAASETGRRPRINWIAGDNIDITLTDSGLAADNDDEMDVTIDHGPIDDTPVGHGGIVHYDYCVDQDAGHPGDGTTVETAWGSDVIGYNDISTCITAIDADNAHRSLLINLGTYNEAVTIPSTVGAHNIWIHGEARERVLIGQESASAHAFTLASANNPVVWLKNVTLRGNSGSGSSLRSTVSGAQIHCEDCVFNAVVGTSAGSISSSTFRNCYFTGGYAVAALGQTNATNFFDQCKFSAAMTWSTETQHHKFTECWFESTLTITDNAGGHQFIGCRWDGTATAKLTINGAVTIDRGFQIEGCTFGTPSANGAIYLQASSACTGMTIINNHFEMAAGGSTNPYITCDDDSFRGLIIANNTFDRSSGNYVEDNGGVSITGVFVDCIIGPNSPEDYAVTIETGSSNCLIITNGTVDVAAGCTGITVCGDGEITGAGRLGVTRAVAMDGTAAPTHAARAGTIFVDTTNLIFYVNVDDSTTWMVVGGTGTAVPGTIILQEDNADVNTATRTLDFTEPDGTLLSSSGTEVDVNMALYAKLAGRSGGQTLIGGTNAGSNLNLRSNSSSDGRIVSQNSLAHRFTTAVEYTVKAATIASGEIDILSANNTLAAYLTLAGAGGAADDLAGILVGSVSPTGNTFLILRPVSDSVTITVKHEGSEASADANKIHLQGHADYAMDDQDDMLVLIYDTTIERWVEVARSSGVTDHVAATDPHTGYVLESLLDAKGDIYAASADNTPAKVTVGANERVLRANSAATPGVAWEAPAVGIVWVFDGGGAEIADGVSGYLSMPFNATITGWDIYAEQAGDIVVDVWKDTYANAPPTVADTIAGTEKPTLAGAAKNQDHSLSSWTTAITAGDVLGFNVDSATTVMKVTLVIWITRP